MLRSRFIGTVLVIILGVNLGAWTLSIATSSSPTSAMLTVPVSAAAIDARSEAASVELTQSAIMNDGSADTVTDTTSTTTTASSTQGW